MATNEDNLEYAVSQAVDDVLSDFDRHNLGDRLASAEAHQLAADHEKLNALLRAHDPLPAVDFNAFASSISSAIDAEAEAGRGHVPSAVRMRPTWTRRLAWAAAVGLVATAAWPFLPHGADNSTNPGGNLAVQGPTTGVAVAAGTLEIKVGPSEVMVQRGLAQGLSPDAGGKSKPVVVITSATQPSDLRPY